MHHHPHTASTAYPLHPPVFLMGPTATGKTALALAFAKHFPVEIISVDSALIYRGMDIGTGKPNNSELAEVPHHLIDIRDPAESYSAENFRQDALNCIADIRARHKIPLLVGGTLLYFSTLLQGLSQLPSANPSIRDRLLQEAITAGSWQLLHHRLSEIDPASALRIHPNDGQRIQRALEVFEITGKSLSDLIQDFPPTVSEIPNSPSPLIFLLTTDTRAELHHRIETRFHQMLNQGFVTEVQTLFARGDLDLNKPAIRAVGYRQCWRYLQGEYGHDEMVEKAIAATRQLAKRQLTGLRALGQKLNFSQLNINKIKLNNSIQIEFTENSIKSELTKNSSQSTVAEHLYSEPQPSHVYTLAHPQPPHLMQNFSKNFFQLSANDHSASLKFMIHSVTQSGNY